MGRRDALAVCEAAGHQGDGPKDQPASATQWCGRTTGVTPDRSAGIDGRPRWRSAQLTVSDQHKRRSSDASQHSTTVSTSSQRRGVASHVTLARWPPPLHDGERRGGVVVLSSYPAPGDVVQPVAAPGREGCDITPRDVTAPVACLTGARVSPSTDGISNRDFARPVGSQIRVTAPCWRPNSGHHIRRCLRGRRRR